MAYKMFSIGLIVLAFVSMSMCQQLRQPNAGLPSQYLPSALSQGAFQGSSAAVQQAQTQFEGIENQSYKLSSSNLEVPQQSQSYQDAVQQQNLAQSYQRVFENTGVQNSIVTPNSYRDNQESQQYYVPSTQQSAAPQFITKESYSASLPAVIPTTTATQYVQPYYKQQFITPIQAQPDIPIANVAQAQQEYRQKFAALEQAQLEYKQQFVALSQANEELKQQLAAPLEAQQELKKQFTELAQAQQDYKQQFSALALAQKEYKQQFAALNEAQQELKQQFTVPIQAQLENKQQFGNLEQSQLESKQQFAAIIQTQKELKQQVDAATQIPQEYKQPLTAPAQQVYRQRFVGPAPTYQYVQKPATAAATGPVNYSYVAQYPVNQIKPQTVAAAQPKIQYAALPQQYQQQQYYYTVPTGQVTVTEQPRVQQSVTKQASSGVVISTTPTPLKESIIYKS